MVTSPENSGGGESTTASASTARAASWTLCAALAITLSVAALVMGIISSSAGLAFDGLANLSWVTKSVIHPWFWPAAWTASMTIIGIAAAGVHRGRGVMTTATILALLACLWVIVFFIFVLGLIQPTIHISTPLQ